MKKEKGKKGCYSQSVFYSQRTGSVLDQSLQSHSVMMGGMTTMSKLLENLETLRVCSTLRRVNNTCNAKSTDLSCDRLSSTMQYSSKKGQCLLL